MSIEHEVKFFVDDVDDLRRRLEASGPIKHISRYMMKRRIFDYPDLRLNAAAAWVRVRDESGGVTLSFKQRRAETISGMIEHEVVVSDFQECCELLQSIGLCEKSYQESFREEWILPGGSHVTFDEWPWLPLICEIEGSDEDAVFSGTSLINMSVDQCVADSIDGMYLRAYDLPITHDNRTALSIVPRYSFDDTPPPILRGGLATSFQAF